MSQAAIDPTPRQPKQKSVNACAPPASSASPAGLGLPSTRWGSGIRGRHFLDICCALPREAEKKRVMIVRQTVQPLVCLTEAAPGLKSYELPPACRQAASAWSVRSRSPPSS